MSPSRREERVSATEREHEDGTEVAREVRRTSPLRRLVGLLAVFVLAAALAAAGYVYWALQPVEDTARSVEFEVLPGWGASRVASALERQGLVRNGRVFSAYLRLQGLDRSIGEGLYDLDPGTGAAELARRLVEGGRPRVAQVVIPEGLRAGELARRLENAGLHPAEAYMELVRRPGPLRPAFVPPEATLEGYLFPASYEIPYRDEPAEVLARFLERFELELDDYVRSRLEELDMSVHEWVTLASLVQSEAGGDDEMALIAGVFLNRLDLGMPLQSDPTVAYGLDKPLPELDPLAGDMRSDHPWNTYTRAGLPAGPISNPGRAALRAVLDPVREDPAGRDYLYFLHGYDDGEPVFRPNTALDDHNRDVARFLRGQ